jgi:hypothetical protein
LCVGKLESSLGESITSNLLLISGVPMHVSNNPENLIDGINRLRTDWGFKNDLTTFMCDSVAARIDQPALWDGLEHLRTDWGFK